MSRAQLHGPARLVGASVAVALCVLGCDADPAEVAPPPPPEELTVTQVSYFLTVDWEESPLEGGERLIVTDLGYTIGLHTWRQSITNIELVPCYLSFRHLGHAHDVSQVELQWNEDLVDAPPTQRIGSAPGVGLSYCSLYQILGTVTVDDAEPEIVAELSGWYQTPDSPYRHPFEATNTVPLALLPDLGGGAWDPALAGDEGHVEMVWRPARAFDGLEIDALSGLDLAFSASQKLGWDVTVPWSIGEL